MSDSIGGPSGSASSRALAAKNSSPFSRLRAGKVGESKEEAGGVDSPQEWNERPRVFRQVESRDGAGARLVGLDDAVKNTKEAAQSINTLAAASADVVDSNTRATEEASIKNVGMAVELADKIASELLANRQLFEDAQVSGLKGDSIAEVLQSPLEDERLPE